MQKKVLIVEDNETFRKLLGDALAAAGFTVSTASDGDEGVTKAVAEHPDIVLLDMRMPRLSGLDALRQIRAADSWGKSVPALMLTEVRTIDTIADAVQLGTKGYVIKNEQTIEEIVALIKKNVTTQ